MVALLNIYIIESTKHLTCPMQHGILTHKRVQVGSDVTEPVRIGVGLRIGPIKTHQGRLILFGNNICKLNEALETWVIVAVRLQVHKDDWSPQRNRGQSDVNTIGDDQPGCGQNL
jgi:hypothetical protein